jgi:hypothetical protein
MAFPLLIIGGAAALTATALNRTADAERQFYENMSRDEVLTPALAQRFPYTHMHVQLNSLQTRPRKFNIYGETPTRTFIGELGTSSITGLGKLDYT